MRRFITFSLALTVLAQSIASAQSSQLDTNNRTTLNLRDCMEYAVEHSIDIQTRRYETSDARIDRRDAILKAFTPYISGNTYAYSYFGRNIDPETNTYVSTTSFNNGLSLGASIPIFNGFEAVNNLRITKTALAMGLSEEEQETDKVCLATMEAYFNVIYYSELTNILEEQVETARSSVKLAERQEELGSKGHADVVQMRADLSDREYELVSARNSLANAYITLGDVMLWPLDQELVIDTDIDALVSADHNQIADTEEIALNAAAFLPSVRIARGNRDNARLEMHTAAWKFLPSLSLSSGWSTSYYTYPGREDYVSVPYFTQFKQNAGEYIQLSLNIPIYGRLEKISTLGKKRNAYKRADLQYEKTLRSVESEVRRAVQDRDGAEAALLQAERRADVQNEAFRLNFRKFDQGLISSIEFNTASANYLKARAEQLNAKLQYILKDRVVRYYNGVHYIEQ